MRLFRHLLRSSRTLFLFAIVTGTISGGTGAGFIAMVNQALTGDGRHRPSVIWGYVALCAITITTRFLSQVLLFRLSQGAIYHLRRQLIEGILDAPLRAVERIGSPRLYSALSDDVVVIADALPGLPGICSGIAFVLVALGYLLTVSPLVAGSAVAAVVLGVLLYLAFSASGTGSLRLAREEQDRLFGHFRAATEGIKELKLNRARREALIGQELDATAVSYRRHSVAGLTVFEGATQSGQAVFFGLIGVLLFVLPGLVAIDTDTLASSVLILLFAVASMQGVLTWLPSLGRATVALEEIEARLAQLESAGRELPADPVPALADWRTISFRQVSHVYPGPAGEEFVLGPLDFEFRRGEVLFVVGGNGSGKTTMAKVLTSLYPPEKGGIWVDGTQVTAENRDAYRQLFSAVFSDFFLFDSLRGLTEDRAATVEHYLRRLQLDHKVRLDGDRFSTTALSLGQRKRLALLVAFLEDRSFYVFDEWAADQDPVFKEFFYHELLSELKARDKTVVVISHDERYFPVADRLVRLDYGQIRQEEISGGQAVAGRPGTGSAG